MTDHEQQIIAQIVASECGIAHAVANGIFNALQAALPQANNWNDIGRPHLIEKFDVASGVITHVGGHTTVIV